MVDERFRAALWKAGYTCLRLIEVGPQASMFDPASRLRMARIRSRVTLSYGRDWMHSRLATVPRRSER